MGEVCNNTTVSAEEIVHDDGSSRFSGTSRDMSVLRSCARAIDESLPVHLVCGQLPDHIMTAGSIMPEYKAKFSLLAHAGARGAHHLMESWTNRCGIPALLHTATCRLPAHQETCSEGVC